MNKIMSGVRKLNTLVSYADKDFIGEVKERIKNRDMLNESKQIAIKILMRLDELKWNQKTLAKELNVSAQQVSKIISGKENLTLESLIKLQNILNIPLLASFYEEKQAKENIIESKEIEAEVTCVDGSSFEYEKELVNNNFSNPFDYAV